MSLLIKFPMSNRKIYFQELCDSNLLYSFSFVEIKILLLVNFLYLKLHNYLDLNFFQLLSFAKDRE